METMIASQPVFTKEFRSACTDVLSQAINGEIAGLSNEWNALNMQIANVTMQKVLSM